MTRFILTPVGSGGDVHPFLGIGRELKARGHEVVVIVNAAFQHAVEREGLIFVPFGSKEDYLTITENPDLWHPRKGIEVVFSRLGEELQTGYEAIQSVWEPGRSILVGHSLSFASRVFEETQGAKCATIHLSPNVFRSELGQPALAPGINPTRLPRIVKRYLWRAIDRFAVDPLIAPALNAWRQSLGLAPVSRVFESWIHSPNRVIALFPDWFAPRQPDWPEQLLLAGFPLFDDPGESVADADLDQWIDDGEPPIVFTPGTANQHARPFFTAALEAVVALGRRGLFLTTFDEHLPALDERVVRHAAYVPFSAVLRRCAAIVHHGGIGTCAQALAAGIPQLVMPMGFDQPDNADRLVKLGVGAWLKPSRFNGSNVERALRRLLGDAGVVDACRTAKARLDVENGLARTCDDLETLGS